MKQSFDSMPLPNDPVGDGVPIPNQCSASNRAGERCRRSATFGLAVCHLHGGATPQTIASCSRRFKEAAGDAMNNLVDIANNSADEGIKLRANIAILDRTGHGPSASLKIGHEASSPWTAWLTNDELEQARALRDAAIARMDAGEPPHGEVREFDVSEHTKEVWLPKSERPMPPTGDEVIEAVYTETRTEGE